MSEIKWNLKTYKIADLTDYYKNPRQLNEKQFNQLKKSIDKFGMIDKPIINADKKNTIIGGHQRLHVIRADKSESVECWVPDRELDEKEVEELNIRLNKNTGEWDFDVLANSFEMDDLLEWGFSHDELQIDGISFEEENLPDDVEPQIDKAEELREKWGVETGQMWKLGEHRLVCGDCRDDLLISRLMHGENAVAMWTDPPYGVDYVGKTKDALTIEGDGADGLQQLLSGAFLTADSILGDGSPIYVAHPSGALQMIFGKCFTDVGWKFHETLVWVKDSMVLGHSDYHYKHEPILYGWKGKNRKWYAGRDQVSVFDIPRPKRSELHPTMKPPELVEAMLKNSTKKDDIVYEPFSGSGTTIIACERLLRKCRAVEISPAYVAVIIERWTNLTGKKAELIG